MASLGVSEWHRPAFWSTGRGGPDHDEYYNLELRGDHVLRLES